MEITREIFKAIEGFEGLYEISNMGRVKSCKRIIKSSKGYRKTKECIISQKDDTNGYLIVNLWKDNKQYHFKVHRLVAKAFIQNPNSFRDVNHLDENKHNNKVSNLEWVSHKDNLNYGTRSFRANNTRSKEIGQYDKNTGVLLATYENAYIAEKLTNICECNINQCCLYKRKTAGGYKWRYTNF